jgi:putative transposase
VILYRFIDAQKATFTIRALCRCLAVPESSYYDWDHHGRQLADARTERDAGLVAEIRRVHDESTSTYGSPRIVEELNDDGIVVSRRKVAELMAVNGIAGLSGREHSTTTTRADRMAAPFPDLVQRDFQPARPDTVWYGDVTYIWVAGMFWYLATVIDASSKEVIGWAFADHMRTELVATALRRAVARRGRLRRGVIFHTDRGSQYTSAEFGRLCRSFGIRQSMGRRGTCYDNAGAESFFATLKRELVDRYVWKSSDQLHNGLFTWIETWYNRRRRHSTLGYLTPAQADMVYRQLGETA